MEQVKMPLYFVRFSGDNFLLRIDKNMHSLYYFFEWLETYDTVFLIKLGRLVHALTHDHERVYSEFRDQLTRDQHDGTKRRRLGKEITQTTK